MDRLAGASRVPFWFTTVADAGPRAAASGEMTCDLAIVGGGFTGLWAALKAREQAPDARIVVLEAGRCGQDASGRSGGFCAPSISHGAGNARARRPGEAEALIRLGRRNLNAKLEISSPTELIMLFINQSMPLDLPPGTLG